MRVVGCSTASLMITVITFNFKTDGFWIKFSDISCQKASNYSNQMSQQLRQNIRENETTLHRKTPIYRGIHFNENNYEALITKLTSSR